MSHQFLLDIDDQEHRAVFVEPIGDRHSTMTPEGPKKRRLFKGCYGDRSLRVKAGRACVVAESRADLPRSLQEVRMNVL